MLSIVVAGTQYLCRISIVPIRALTYPNVLAGLLLFCCFLSGSSLSLLLLASVCSIVCDILANKTLLTKAS